MGRTVQLLVRLNLYSLPIIAVTGFVIAAFTVPANADLFVSAAGTNSVMQFDETTGTFLGNFVSPGSGGLGNPQGIAFGPDGNLYVASQGSNNVLRYDGQTGAFIDVFASVAGTTWPAEINFRGGYLYMSDFAAGGAVYRFDENTGAFVDQFASGTVFADGQEWDSNGDLYVSAGTVVRRHDGVTGAFIDNFVAGGIGLALDNLFLPDGSLLVSDFGTGNIKHYDATGAFLGNVITNLAGPQGLEIGPDGNLYAGSFNTGVINIYDINTFAQLGTAADATTTTNNFTFSPQAPIPEPGTTSLLVTGISIVVMTRRRRR